MQRQILLIDFDSTFITCEGLDVLFEISLKNHLKKDEIVSQIKSITKLGMEGKMTFDVSLQKRISLLKTDIAQIENTANLLAQKVSVSILKNKPFFLKNTDDIYIVSGGFKELIRPTAKLFGILENHIFANTFKYDSMGQVIGIDTTNLMSQDKGKVKTVRSLNLQSDMYILGDGFTDYELKKEGLAKKFIAFTENIARDKIVELADYQVRSFDEFLYLKDTVLKNQYE